MKAFFFVIWITISLSKCVYCQDLDNSFSFNFGVNLSHPTFIYFNKESVIKSIPNLQLEINKEFFIDKPWGLNLTLGANRNSFNARRQLGSVYSIKQLDFSYICLESGPSYKIPFNHFCFWGAVNLRVSRLLTQNLSDYYTTPSLSSSDLGLNLKMGAKLLRMPMRPYLLVNYYYGLNKVAKNYILTGTGQSLSDYIRNRSIGLQLGLYF